MKTNLQPEYKRTARQRIVRRVQPPEHVRLASNSSIAPFFVVVDDATKRIHRLGIRADVEHDGEERSDEGEAHEFFSQRYCEETIVRAREAVLSVLLVSRWYRSHANRQEH